LSLERADHAIPTHQCDQIPLNQSDQDRTVCEVDDSTSHVSNSLLTMCRNCIAAPAVLKISFIGEAPMVA